MMRNETLRFFIYFLMIFAIEGLSQPQIEKREGTVTYQTPQNVYVKFSSTENMVMNDTLYVSRLNVLVPAIQVKFL